MNFRTHSALEGRHAFLSASKYHWVNYSVEKLENAYRNYSAQILGTKFHEFAKKAIELGVQMPRSKSTLNLYINDAIKFKMTPEQPLYYSENAFGTADAICFDEENMVLRIHDLKTGVTKASFVQLEVYAALFCLEYGVNPYDIDFKLRIYQSNEVRKWQSPSEVIRAIMDQIVIFDKEIEKWKGEF